MVTFHLDRGREKPIGFRNSKIEIEKPLSIALGFEVEKPLGCHNSKIEIEKPLNCPKF